jgi:hypothetical protein
MSESHIKEKKVINKPFLEYYKEQKLDEKDDCSEEELDQMYLQLQRENDEMFDNMVEEPITDAEYQEMEAGPYEPLFDYGTGKWSIAKDIEAFYGKDILSRIIRENQKSMLTDLHGQVSKEIYHEMKCLREGITPKKTKGKKPLNNQKTKKPEKYEPVSIQRERQPGDDYFLRIERGLIRNESYRKIFCGSGGMIYQWLWAYIARKKWNDTTGYPLKKDYYDKGLLACTMSLRHIAEKCWMSKNTVKKHIDILKEEGVIKVKYFVPKDKKRGQNIYILGEWKKVDGDKIQETFYLNQVYLSN